MIGQCVSLLLNFSIMKQLFYCIIACLIISCNAKKTFELQTKIDEVKQEFAPDKRVAIFNIEAYNATDGSIIIKGETNLPEALSALKEKFPQQTSLIDSVQLLPANYLNGLHYGVVTLSVCNIRSKPKHSAELATQALQGMPLKIFKKQDNWYYVQTPDNYLGWLDAGGLAVMNASDFNTWDSLEKVMYIKDNGYVYDLNTNAILSDVVIGNKFAVIDKNNEQITVKLPDGRIGWIASTETSMYLDWVLSRKMDTAHIIETASSFMGRPYLWGGTSPKAMDCSGFTKMVYYLNGVELARDASQQVKDGELVEIDPSLKNLIKGDLLFFGSQATPIKKERIWHVAIYIGEGEIIHASGAIKIESLVPGTENFAEKRLNTLIRARRIIGTNTANNLKIKA